MPGRVLRHPFALGFLLTVLASVTLLFLLGPTTGWAQGPGNSNAVSPSQGGWIPINGGEERLSRGSTAAFQVTQHPMEEQPGGMVPPGAAHGDEQGVNTGPDSSSESFGEELQGPLRPNVPGAYGSPLVIPAADFRNNGGLPGGYFFPFDFLGDGGYVRSTGGIPCMMAPAYLPIDATVYQLWVAYLDNGGVSRPWLNLYRVNNFNAALPSDTMGSVVSSSTGASIQNGSDSTIDYPTVTYPGYSYYVGGCLNDAAQRFYAVRLWYTLP